MIVDIQFNQGHYTWPELREAARAAEDAGFSTLWISDHLAGEVMAAASMPECFTLLGALAEATSTIGLGVLVANVGTRHAAVFANSAATAQNISGGRFILGLGAGASPSSPFASELHAIEMPIPATMAERHARVEKTLDVTVEAAELIRSAPHVELLVEPELSVLLFRRVGWDAAALNEWSERILAEGVAFVVPTSWQGETCLRLCIVNPETTSADVALVLESLQ